MATMIRAEADVRWSRYVGCAPNPAELRGHWPV